MCNALGNTMKICLDYTQVETRKESKFATKENQLNTKEGNDVINEGQKALKHAENK